MSEIEIQCLSLSRGERERLARVLMESLECKIAKKTLDEIHDVVVKVVGFEFNKPGRDLFGSIGRALFAHFACREGYSENQVGNYLNRDHSTVNGMKGRVRNWLEVPQFYKTEHQWYEQIKKELYETDR